MSKLFRLIYISVAITIMISVFIIPASSAIAPQKYGDVNYSGEIDIMDATDIQRYISKIDLRAINIIESADVDNDVKITIMDATTIQRYVAQIITEFPAGKTFGLNKYFYGVNADYDKDSAIAGYPVTFSARGYMEPTPTTAKLYINEELVEQTQQLNEETDSYDLIYTFEQAGVYRVCVTLCDKWGVSKSYNSLYFVQEEPGDTTIPIITAVTRDQNYISKPTFTVNTKFGTEPYQYRYTLYSYGEKAYSTDFTDSNTFTSPFNLRSGQYINDDYQLVAPYTLKVEVKDAEGKTAVDEYSFEIEELKPA